MTSASTTTKTNTRNLLQTLPYPLAVLVLRALNGKSAPERHHSAYYLAECALKLAAAAGVFIRYHEMIASIAILFLYTPIMIAISTRLPTSWPLVAGCLILATTIGCRPSIPQARTAGISYSTVPSTWPANPTCLNPKTPTGFAKEVLMGRTLTVVVAAGANPISDAHWATYSPSFGNIKNSDRHVLFSSSCFARSPGTPADCEGDACKRIVELDGHTWVGLSKVEAADCMPDADHCDGVAAKPGGLVFVVTRKCHELVFNGTVRILRGPKGEKAVMHSTPNGIATTNVTLPSGWKLTEETLTEPLVVHPFGGGDECFYNIIRDHLQQGYHQIGYAGSTYP